MEKWYEVVEDETQALRRNKLGNSSIDHLADLLKNDDNE